MGDVHPHALKARLARELSRFTFERWTCGNEPQARGHNFISGKTLFCNSGFEAVEAALKTALLATGKPGVIAFERAYHGLGYGALNATHRDYFRRPFGAQLRAFGQFVPFPVHPEQLDGAEGAVRRLLQSGGIGAILVEPVQARGGIHVPAPGFLPMLRSASQDAGAVLVLDEIYTGFGRTGRLFACEHWGVTPDIICLGKALTGGFPLSACVGRADIMDAAWPPSTGEAIHTSTFLGHPVGCAMALAQIEEVIGRGLPERAAVLGKRLLLQLDALAAPAGLELNARGMGLLAGLEVRRPDGSPATGEALDLIKGMLKKGFILLPEGDASNVIAFAPPLTIAEKELDQTVCVLETLLELSKSRTGLPTARKAQRPPLLR
jgi:4-aminobutyrate aminotransferase-like enzyme